MPAPEPPLDPGLRPRDLPDGEGLFQQLEPEDDDPLGLGFGLEEVV